MLEPPMDVPVELIAIPIPVFTACFAIPMPAFVGLVTVCFAIAMPIAMPAPPCVLHVFPVPDGPGGGARLRPPGLPGGGGRENDDDDDDCCSPGR